ncbi:MAG TPA: MFS transporter [Candidatus Binataceae bacterium]|nr:MFS transporter [Candidatus Binataceae bacterium]
MTQRTRGWLTVAGLWISLALLWATVIPTTGLFLGPISQAFHTSRAAVSLISSLLAVGACVGALISGWLIGFVDARRVMLLGALVLVFTYVVASQVQSFSHLLVCYVILGMGVGISTLVPASFIVGNWFEEGSAGIAMGITMTGNSASSAVTVMLINYAITHWGWRHAYLALAIPIVIIEIPLITLLRPRPIREMPEGAAKLPLPSEGFELGQALRTREFWLIVVGQFLFGWVANGILTHMVPYLQNLAYTRSHAAEALSLVMLLTSVGKISLGLTADRVGARWAAALNFAIEAVGVAFLIGAARLHFLIPGLICYGLTWGTPLALLPFLTIQSLGLKRYGAIAGLTNVAFTAGNALGALATGWIFDITGSYADAFAVMAAFTFVGVFAAAACRPLSQTMPPGERQTVRARQAGGAPL